MQRRSASSEQTCSRGEETHLCACFSITSTESSVPRMILTPALRRLAARESSDLTRAVTLKPLLSSRWAMGPPTKPVAPRKRTEVVVMVVGWRGEEECRRQDQCEPGK
jgi:hypothetical protein